MAKWTDSRTLFLSLVEVGDVRGGCEEWGIVVWCMEFLRSLEIDARFFGTWRRTERRDALGPE